MNLLLVHLSEFEGSDERQLWITGRRFDHLRNVLGVSESQRVRCGVEHGPIGQARIVELQRDRVLVELGFDTTTKISAPICELIVALPRPKAVPRLLEDVASFGVRAVHLVNAWKVEKSYLGASTISPEARALAVRRGCEQGGTTWVPSTELHRLFVPFVHGLAPVQSGEQRIMLDPGAPVGFGDAYQGGRVTFAVGPEGGWVEQEIASLAQAGFEAAHLGRRTLRTGVAAIAALAQLQALRDFGPSSPLPAGFQGQT